MWHPYSLAVYCLLTMHGSAWPQPTSGSGESVPTAVGVAVEPQMLTLQSSGVQASLRGLFAVSADVAWCSGTAGTVLRTANGGQTWQNVSVPGASALDFRDLHAFSDRAAIVISAGSPGRIYRTRDGGKSWALSYENDDPAIFFDALSFWDDQRGLAFSDPQHGRFFLLETRNGGTDWSPLPESSLPIARQGEAGFAASGTCLAVAAAGRAWIGLGRKVEAPRTARVLLSTDYGHHWLGVPTPLPASESQGIFSLAMIDRDLGIAVGGDYLQPDAVGVHAAITSDGGRSWRVPEGKGPRGYRSAVACVRRRQVTVLVAAGPSGIDYSGDLGDNWVPLQDVSLHALAFARDGTAGWGCGAEGTIVHFDLDRLEALARAP